MDHGVWCHDAVRRRVGLDHLELHRSHTTSNQEDVTFVQRPVSLKKVRLQVDIKQVAANTQHSDATQNEDSISTVSSSLTLSSYVS